MCEIPALLIKISMVAYSSTTASTASFTCCRLAISHFLKKAWPFSVFISSTTSLAPFSSISKRQTMAPCRANKSEIALPIPLPPPVTRATLFSNLSMLFIVYVLLKRRRTDTGPSPVNHYILSGDMLCLIRYQKQGCMGNICDMGWPPHWRDFGPNFFVIRIFYGPIGQRGPRGNGIYVDLVL